MAWWGQILDDFEPAADESGLRGPGGRSLLFLNVPDPTTVKNRLHMGLRTVDRSRDEEIEQPLGLGATMVKDSAGRRWPRSRTP